MTKVNREVETIRCAKCGEEKAVELFSINNLKKRGYSYWCKDCHYHYEQHRDTDKVKKAKAEHYQKNKEKFRLRDRYAYLNKNEEFKAHSLVSKALHSGKLIKQPCEVCGATKTQGHHWDYKKPLSVVWLCLSHHRKMHSSLPRFIEDMKSQTRNDLLREIMEEMPKDVDSGWGDDSDYANGYRDGFKQHQGEVTTLLERKMKR